MQDYHGNSRKSKEEKDRPEKKIEKVVSGDVVIQKKGLGAKIKDTFIEADFKSVARYVVSDVLIPAMRNMIVDASTRGVERMMYGESRDPRRRGFSYGGPRTTYNMPVNRGYPDPRRPRLPERTSRRTQDDYIVPTREEADMVLERMNDIVDQYEVASVSDLHELLGLETSHVDHKWGWLYIGDARARQVREGYLLELPPAEPIN